MTLDAQRLDRAPVHDALIELSQLAATVAESLATQVQQAGILIAECLQAGRKVLACGNGGSAADAQHFVAEFVGHMSRERESLPGVSLTTDPSVMTALANDYGYERVFARQVEGLGRTGDVLVAISTSGRSPNVLNAIAAAHENGLRTIALVGEGGDTSLAGCDICLHVPSRNTQRVQEIHMAVLHAICEVVDEQVVGPGSSTMAASQAGE
jgi:D-sedoheptulose 7-phosphate isomerase